MHCEDETKKEAQKKGEEKEAEEDEEKEAEEEERMIHRIGRTSSQRIK